MNKYEIWNCRGTNSCAFVSTFQLLQTVLFHPYKAEGETCKCQFKRVQFGSVIQNLQNLLTKIVDYIKGRKSRVS
jgi:hypothetical protein